MKYYQLKLRSYDENIKDELSEGPKVYPRANGDRVSNSNGFLSKGGEFGKIFFENYVDDAPIFDYFYLYNLSYKKEYDWILLDAYGYIGQNIPSARGFLVSRKLKETLEEYSIAKPFRFYKSKLMYKGEKLEYFIFHLAQNEWNEFNSEQSSFFMDNKRLDVKVSSNKELKKILKSNLKIKMNLVFENQSDIFYFSQLGYLISELLKNKLEELKISGFEFNELKNVTISFTNRLV
ncbi:hypothetical protein [Zobellia nedashkovskayae]|uniref:hypothetical protein n=1 Tax=Zobellia nedashkovskayae TaxID=2779510 RepID=UPI00188D6B84|nr:hypothetical protein [Zobellia nedashkovskayae]